MRLLLNYLASCWFNKNPADLRPTRSFMWKVLAFYLTSGIVVESLIADPADGTLEVLLRTFMAFSSISTLLLVIKKPGLLHQLFTSIFVCENFIMTLAIAAETLDYIMVRNHWPDREEISISIGVLLVVWYIAIVSYIIRRFFAYPLSRSVTLALSYFILTYGLPMLFMDL
ncbi:MAG: hypothetical protein PHW13_05625 [Methylococcales bacterium]|nr:hypothetical protein [Methylococcales bacterium]